MQENPNPTKKGDIDHHANHDDHNEFIPSNFASNRPPQLTPANRCQVCGHQLGGTDGGGGSDGSGGGIRRVSALNAPYRSRDGIAAWTMQVPPTDEIDSPEGLERHHPQLDRPLRGGGQRIWIEGHGMIPLWKIILALPAHLFCPCGHILGSMGGEDPYAMADETTYSPDDISPTSSMYVEANSSTSSSAEHSPVSLSGYSSRARSYMNLDLAFVGTGFAAEIAGAPTLRHLFVTDPLPLVDVVQPTWPGAAMGAAAPVWGSDSDSDAEAMEFSDEDDEEEEDDDEMYE